MNGAWSPARALLWESWRLSWRPVLGTTVAACVFAAMYRRALAPLGERRDELVFVSLLMTMLVVHAMTLLSCRDDRLGIGFEPRLFRLPLATAALAGARLLPSLLFVVLMQATVSLFMRGVYGAPWPIAGPCLLAAAIASWTLALTWTFGGRPYLIAPFALPLLALLLGWIRPLLRADPLWSDLRPRDFAVLGAAIAFAAVVAAVGVARSRSAGSAPPARLHAALRVVEAVTRSRAEGVDGAELYAAPRATSPFRAQLWMEWREKGRLVATCALFGLCAAVAGSSIPVPDTARLLGAALHFLPMMLLVLPPIAGALQGPFDVSRRISGMDPFRAVRPMSDRALAHALLHAAARAAAAGWAIALAGVSLLMLALYWLGDAAQVEALLRAIAAVLERMGAGGVAVAVLLVLGIAWSALGLVAAATMCGRGWVVTLGYVMPFVGVSVIVVTDVTGSDLLVRLASKAVVAFGVVMPAVAAMAWYTAVRRRIATARGAIRVALACASGTVILALLLPSLGGALGVRGHWPSPLSFLAPGFVASVLLPHALAPLALGWNRHR